MPSQMNQDFYINLFRNIVETNRTSRNTAFANLQRIRIQISMTNVGNVVALHALNIQERDAIDSFIWERNEYVATKRQLQKLEDEAEEEDEYEE